MEGFRRGPLDLAWSALATNVLTVHTVGFYAILPHEIDLRCPYAAVFVYSPKVMCETDLILKHVCLFRCFGHNRLLIL